MIVTKLLGQKVTGQKVTIYIFYPGRQKVTICIHLDSCMYAGRTESHNMYTLIHACMHNFAICIVLKTDRNIVYGSFCCFKLYYSLSYQLAVWYMLFLKYSLFKTSSLLQDKEQQKLYSYFFVSNCKDWFFVLDFQVIV